MKKLRPQWLPEIPEEATYEEYNRLRCEQVCQGCGMRRVKGGGENDYQDPCIPNLPGVIAACCGHGAWNGYVLFDNGVVLRGKFDHMPEITSTKPAKTDRKEYLKLKARERRARQKAEKEK